MKSRNRGKKKPKLRDLSREAPTYEEKSAAFHTLAKEHAIVTAVLGASLVEHELETLLQRKFARKEQDTWEELTEDRGPLDTFSRKIIAGYAFRLYDKAIRHNLDTIRNIRNVFAHTKKPRDFDHELIHKALSSVQLPKGRRSPLYKFLTEIKEGKLGPKYGFVALCVLMNTELIKARSRSYSATIRNYNRSARRTPTRTSQAPYTNALIAALVDSQPESQKNSLQSLLRYQSGDP